MNFEFKNEVTKADLQVNKRMLKWRQFWNNVYETQYSCNAPLHPGKEKRTPVNLIK